MARRPWASLERVVRHRRRVLQRDLPLDLLRRRLEPEDVLLAVVRAGTVHTHHQRVRVAFAFALRQFDVGIADVAEADGGSARARPEREQAVLEQVDEGWLELAYPVVLHLG